MVSPLVWVPGGPGHENGLRLHVIQTTKATDRPCKCWPCSPLDLKYEDRCSNQSKIGPASCQTRPVGLGSPLIPSSPPSASSASSASSPPATAPRPALLCRVLASCFRPHPAFYRAEVICWLWQPLTPRHLGPLLLWV